MASNARKRVNASMALRRLNAHVERRAHALGGLTQELITSTRPKAIAGIARLNRYEQNRLGQPGQPKES